MSCYRFWLGSSAFCTPALQHACHMACHMAIADCKAIYKAAACKPWQWTMVQVLWAKTRADFRCSHAHHIVCLYMDQPYYIRPPLKSTQSHRPPLQSHSSPQPHRLPPQGSEKRRPRDRTRDLKHTKFWSARHQYPKPCVVGKTPCRL